MSSSDVIIKDHDPSSTMLYKSLLSWINSFENIKSHSLITSLSDLVDSRLLVECVREATPIRRTQSFENSSVVQILEFESSPDHVNHESNFSTVISTFSEFFGFALDQAIFVPELLTRNEPEFLKLVLVFLAYALQQKPNEMIIQRIFTLENEVQVTLCKLTEEMFQKLGSKQSDIIRDLVIESDLELSQSEDIQNEANNPESDFLELPEKPDMVTPPLLLSPDPLPTDTAPDKLIIEPIISPLFNSPAPVQTQQEGYQFGVTGRYYGFDSPAALKWINQPEIKRSIRRQDFVRPTPSKVQELYQLQHKIDQQQKEIHSLKRFCQECENELSEAGNKCKLLVSECTALRMKCENMRDVEDEKRGLYEENQKLERENKALEQEVSALSEYKEKCSQLQGMAEELASTAQGNQMLILSTNKLQLELSAEKDNCFKLQSEKGALERANLQQQATVQILGQDKELLTAELNEMKEKVTQLCADLKKLKDSEIREIKLEEKELSSGRSDEVALLFKIKLLEDEIHQLRKLIPKVAERDELQVELQKVTSELDAMREEKQELCRLYSEAKASTLRLEGKLVEFDMYKSKLESAKEDLTSLQKENSSLNLEIQSINSTHRTISTEKDRLQLCLDQSEREKEMLKRRATELDTTVISVQETYNELFSLKQKLVLDNDNLEKELNEIKASKSLLQEREVRATTELNAIISQRAEEQAEVNRKLTDLQEKNCSLQNELRNLQLKFSTTASECASKEEMFSSLSESSKKKEQELSVVLEDVKNRNKELQDEIHQIKCESATLQGQMEISNKRYERKAEELEEETKDFKKCLKELEVKLGHSNLQYAENELLFQRKVFSLEENAQALAQDKQSLQQEKQRLTAIVKEYENMEAETNSRVREELEEKRNRVRLLEEKLDDIESERNSLHSQVRSLNVQLQFAETQLMEGKKSNPDSDRTSRTSRRADTLIVSKRAHEDREQFTNISSIPSTERISHTQRPEWGEPVERRCSSRSHSRAAMYSGSIEPEPSMSSIAPIEEPVAPHNLPLYRTDEIKRRNAQNLPHLKSSYPIEFQTTSVSEKYLHSENPNVNPLYQPSKMSQSTVNFAAENPPKRKALAFEIDVGTSEAPKPKKEKDQNATRILRSQKAKFSVAQATSTYRKKKT